MPQTFPCQTFQCHTFNRILEFIYLEDQDRSRREVNWREGCHDDDLVRPKVSLVLVLVARGVLAEDGAGGEPAPSTLENQSLLQQKKGMDYIQTKQKEGTTVKTSPAAANHAKVVTE